MTEKLDYPWFPFYGFDFYNSARVQAMDNATLGVYHRLLWLCWCDGGVPDSIDELRGISRMTAAEFAQAWPRLSKSFRPHPSARGLLYNERMNLERRKVMEKHESLSDRGRRGARKKWKLDSPAIAGHRPADATSTSTLTLTSENPPAAAPPAPKGARRAGPIRKTAGGKPELSPEVRRVLDFIGELRQVHLDAPGLIPDRLAEGYTVYDCLLVFWRARRRWKTAHNQTSPFRPTHFGVLLDEARADVKLGDQGEGGKDFGFVKTWEYFKHQGHEGEKLAEALRVNGYTTDGRMRSIAHYAEHGRFPDEPAREDEP